MSVPSKQIRFARIPSEAISDERVSAAEFRVIAAVAHYADKNWFCYPSVDTLAKLLHCSRAAVQKQIRHAERHGYILVEHRQKPSGAHTSNGYTISAPSAQEAKNLTAHALPAVDSRYPSEEEIDRRCDELEGIAMGATPEVACFAKLIEVDWFIESIKSVRPQTLRPPATPEAAQTDSS